MEYRMQELIQDLENEGYKVSLEYKSETLHLYKYHVIRKIGDNIITLLSLNYDGNALSPLSYQVWLSAMFDYCYITFDDYKVILKVVQNYM